MLLNAAKCHGYSFYRFCVIKGKPTGEELPPPRLGLRKQQKNLKTKLVTFKNKNVSETFKYKSLKVKTKLNNMNQVMFIVKLSKFNMLVKEVGELGQPSKNLDTENRILRHSKEILKDPDV